MIVTTIIINIMMKYNSIKYTVTLAPNDTHRENNAHPKNSPIDCDGVLLTNVQCHMVPIPISWYREYWMIQLKCTLETKQDGIGIVFASRLCHRPSVNLNVLAYYAAAEYECRQGGLPSPDILADILRQCKLCHYISIRWRLAKLRLSIKAS